MPKTRWTIAAAALALTLVASVGRAQRIEPAKGVDSRLDYASLTRLGPWDDRNYSLTEGDLKWLAPNEEEQRDPIPAFFRVLMRKANPKLARQGPAQYPRSALQIFYQEYGGYLVDGKLYRSATVKDGRFVVIQQRGISQEDYALEKALGGEVRVTNPTGAAESAVKIHPTDINKVIGGSNGPGSGQQMHYSLNGGSTWTQAAALPQGGTCCDPTVDWSSDGAFAYAATLGKCSGAGCQVWFYRSNDGGQTWNGLESTTPGDPRRELTRRGSDKEFLHVDKFGTSPNKDSLYLTWHDSNVLKFSRSTDFGNTWSSVLTISSGTTESGIGSDITTDKNGNVYYFWPAFNSRRVLVRKSTNGGASFAPTVTIANTQGSFDFPIPAMETRRAWVYLAGDVDLSNGPFANSIYACWTDTSGPESATPANNHTRIQVAYSRDGGASWTVTTPHETADVNSVDRFNHWLAVGPDGRVYVLFYDTRRDPARLAVDIFYSVSNDGAQTWSTPARLNSVISPQIDTGFEWGDYNGIDVIGQQLIGIYTDNRNESGGATDSVDVYAVGVINP